MKGAIEYVDDFARWTVGSSTDATTAMLQRKVVLKALRSAQDSGASLEAEATFIHFNRRVS
jgi:hypothetical protein